jgi:hypothetical protein
LPPPIQFVSLSHLGDEPDGDLSRTREFFADLAIREFLQPELVKLLNSLASQASWLNLLAAALALGKYASTELACCDEGCNLTLTNFHSPPSSPYVHTNIYDKIVNPQASSLGRKPWASCCFPSVKAMKVIPIHLSQRL